MSRVDLQEFLDAYLGETAELLGAANTLLLAVDAATRRGETAPRQVRELFRALHTVKGLSGMVGVEPVVALSHRMEGVLRDADRAGGRLPDGAVDLLLQGVRAIEQRQRVLEQGGEVPPPPAALLDALDALDPARRARRAAEAAPIELHLPLGVAGKLDPVERDTLIAGARAGQRAVCVRFEPSTERASAGVTITSVRHGLSRVAEIVKVVPLADPDAPARMAFALVALTRADDPALLAAVGLDPGAVTPVAAPAPAPGPAAERPLGPLGFEDGDGDGESVGAGFVRVDIGRLDTVLEHLSAVVVGRSAMGLALTRAAAAGADVRTLARLHREHARLVRDLRASILRLRMVPVADVLERVPIIVRALRRATGKAVRVEIEGGRAELDKAVAERIFPAVVHLVRNAVDHGLEPPEARARAGKPEEGVVSIRARAAGDGKLELTIADDGAGIDAAAVAARAGAAVPATDAALLALLCRPGLSTRAEAGVTSGRGMGMDIVRGIVAGQLGGELVLSTVRGVGTSFRLRVPLTVSIVEALTFECGAQRFAVAMAAVDEILDLDTARVVHPPRRAGGLPLGLIEQRGESVPLVGLAQLFALGGPALGTAPARRALVVRRDGDALAFAVDRMLGQQEVVVRPLEDPLVAVRGVAGATDLGDGRPTLVVDLLALRAQVAGLSGSAA